MKGLENNMKNKQGKIAVFKQLRSSIIELTDAVINEDMQEYDINCAFGALSSRIKAVSNVLQKQENDKVAKRK